MLLISTSGSCLSSNKVDPESTQTCHGWDTEEVSQRNLRHLTQEILETFVEHRFWACDFAAKVIWPSGRGLFGRWIKISHISRWMGCNFDIFKSAGSKTYPQLVAWCGGYIYITSAEDHLQKFQDYIEEAPHRIKVGCFAGGAAIVLNGLLSVIDVFDATRPDFWNGGNNGGLYTKRNEKNRHWLTQWSYDVEGRFKRQCHMHLDEHYIRLYSVFFEQERGVTIDLFWKLFFWVLNSFPHSLSNLGPCYSWILLNCDSSDLPSK